MKYFFLISLFCGCLASFGQLPDGSQAPDFTLTDYYGTTHHLYSYLNEGKTVFVEIFAAHCPSCWNYHQTDILKNIYNSYGPDGTNELMVLALEYDPYNDSTAFTGNHEPWVTQGNWLEGTPFPIFNVEGADRAVFEDYMVSFYPVVYKICPNGILERVMTFETEAQLYEKVQECQALSTGQDVTKEGIYIDPVSQKLIIEPFLEVRSVRIINLQGQVIQSISGLTQSSIDLGGLEMGVYLIEFSAGNEIFVQKHFLR